MKSKVCKIVSLVMVIAILVSVMPLVSAATVRASDYFWCTSAQITPTGSGNMVVEFDVTATETMKEVGTSKVVIYERQSNGTYKAVKTFTRYNTAGLIEYNTFCSVGDVSYKGTPGIKYYAVVTFYAKNAGGSETLNMTTRIITA